MKSDAALYLLSQRSYSALRRGAFGELPGMQPHYPNPNYSEPCLDLPLPPALIVKTSYFSSLFGNQNINSVIVPPVGRKPPTASSSVVVVADGDGGSGEVGAKAGAEVVVAVSGLEAVGATTTSITTTTTATSPPMHASEEQKVDEGHGIGHGHGNGHIISHHKGNHQGHIEFVASGTIIPGGGDGSVDPLNKHHHHHHHHHHTPVTLQHSRRSFF